MFGTGRRSGHRRRYAFTGAVGALALVASACGGSDEGDSGDGEDLTVWIMEGTNPNTDGYVEDLTAAFEQEHGVGLDVEIVPWADAQNKFNTAIAAGESPDVAEVGTTWVPEFAEEGALVDITDNIDEAGLSDGLVPILEEAGTVDGQLYGMPWYGGTRSFLYRTDLFKKAGVEPPTSWDQLDAVAKQLQNVNSDMVTWPIPGDNEFGLDAFIWGNGGEVATEDGGTWTSGYDSSEAQEAIEYYTEMGQKYSTPAAAKMDEAQVQEKFFVKGKSPMMIGGSWTPGAITEANPDLEGKIGVFPIPAKDGGAAPSFFGGSLLSVFEDSEQQDLAFDLVEMMSTGEFAEQWSSQTGFYPATSDALDALGEKDPFAKEMAEVGTSLPNTPKYASIQEAKITANMLTGLLQGKGSVEDASKQAADEMNQIFSE